MSINNDRRWVWISGNICGEYKKEGEEYFWRFFDRQFRNRKTVWYKVKKGHENVMVYSVERMFGYKFLDAVTYGYSLQTDKKGTRGECSLIEFLAIPEYCEKPVIGFISTFNNMKNVPDHVYDNIKLPDWLNNRELLCFDGISTYSSDYCFCIKTQDPKSNKPEWNITDFELRKKSDSFEHINAYGDKFNYSNSLIDKKEDNITVSCCGVIESQGKEKDTGLKTSEICAESSVYFKQGEEMPVELLLGYSEEKMEVSDFGKFNLENLYEGRVYSYSGELNQKGQVCGKLSIIIHKDISKAAIKSRKKIKLNNDVVAKAAEKELAHMIKVKEIYVSPKKGNILEVVYNVPGSKLSIMRQNLDDDGRSFLIEKNDDGYNIIDGLNNPLKCEILPNGDIMVTQKDKKTIILDGETRLPKVVIKQENDDEVSFTFMGEKTDYNLTGKKDKETGKIPKLNGCIELDNCMNWFNVYLDGTTTMADVVRLSQEKISYFGGKPAIKGKKKALEF